MHHYHRYDFTVALPQGSKISTIIGRRSLELLSCLNQIDTTTAIPVNGLSH